MTKKQLISELKRSSTIIDVVSETNHDFDVRVTGKKRKNGMSKTTKEILIAFIGEQREFNKEQKKFNTEQKKFNTEQRAFNKHIESKVDNNTKMIKQNHSMIKKAHPDLF